MSLDARIVNAAVNHAAVLPHGAPGHDSVDISTFFDDPRNLAFGDERGVILLYYVGSGVYDWHYALTPALRGREALQLARQVLRLVFTHYNAHAICGSTPRSNSAARLVNRALGAVPVGKSTDSYGRPCIDYRLEREQWVTFSRA